MNRKEAMKVCKIMLEKQNMIPPSWLLFIAFPFDENYIHEWTEEDTLNYD